MSEEFEEFKVGDVISWGVSNVWSECKVIEVLFYGYRVKNSSDQTRTLMKGWSLTKVPQKPLPNETWYFDGEEESPVRIVWFASSGSPVIEFLYTDEDNEAIKGEIVEYNESHRKFVEAYSPTITKPKTVVKWTCAFFDEYNDITVDVDIYDTEEAAIEDFENIPKEYGCKLIQTIKIEYTPEGK
jgi:hypothetical protein